MDGYPVNKNDEVFVVGKGPGVVTETFSDGSFVVKTGKNSTTFMNGGLLRNNSRLCYWKNPVVILPPKTTAFWNMYIDAATTLYETMAAAYNAGKNS